MPGALQPGVGVAGVAAVDDGKRPPQSIGIARHQDQMDVVRHQHPGPDLDPGRRGMLGKEIP